MKAAGHRPRARRAGLALATALCARGACGDGPTAGSPDCERESPIAVGDRVEGALRQGDRRFDGALIDYYALRLPSAADVVIRLSSVQLDPVLFLFGETGDVVAQAFDPDGTPSGEVETATLLAELTPGCHLIGASAWTRDTTGLYTLDVDDSTGEPAAPGP